MKKPRVALGRKALTKLGLIGVLAALSFGPVRPALANHNNYLTIQVKGPCSYTSSWNVFWRTIDVYGPNGYYRHAKFDPSGDCYTHSATFSSAPYGDYRVRVQWCNQTASNDPRYCDSRQLVAETNRYGQLFSSWRHGLRACWWFYIDNRSGTC